MYTTYETLLVSFPKLYEEVMETDPALMLSSQQVFKFLPGDMFLEILADDHLLTNLFNCCLEYKDEIIKIPTIFLAKFYKGLTRSIFGFGTTANEDTG